MRRAALPTRSSGKLGAEAFDDGVDAIAEEVMPVQTCQMRE
jgi:hypothetical protein